MSILIAVKELYRCFGLFNNHFFSGKLPEPAITIQTKGKRNALGWCSTVEYWKNNDESIKKYEINLSAEDLNREPESILQTLLHEMVHLYNIINGFKDCSRGGTFHNKRFKEAAERFGMHFEGPADKKYGWNFAILNQETVDLIKTWGINADAFKLARQVPEMVKKKANSYKLECPKCGIKLRASKPGIVVMCKSCDTELIEY